MKGYINKKIKKLNKGKLCVKILFLDYAIACVYLVRLLHKD